MLCKHFAVIVDKVMTMRTYSKLCELKTFKERYEYLRIGGKVGDETFGFERYLNQIFYKSPEWQTVRREVILRDNGCDLGIDGYDIRGHIVIHHMNPIRSADITKRSDILLNPEYLITTVQSTHNAIHYGDSSFLYIGMTDRQPNDTCPWRII